MRSGMTLVSVVVAASLAGIVALAIARLVGNQAATVTVIKLQEERETLLKHYKNIVVSGWDSTRGGSCAGAVCSRNGNPIIPYANGSALFLGRNLYEYGYTGGTADRWWKVSAEETSLSGGSVLQADSYAKPDPLVAMKVKVEFIHEEHPTVSTRLAEREEIVFLHHNTAAAIGSNDTDCEDGNHLTQMNSSGSSLYSGTGAIIQYDFNSNYTKCSQVPLVNDEACTGSGALLGFFRTQPTGTPASPQLITGNPICSTKHHTASPTGLAPAAIRRGSAKRTVEAIDCRGRGYVKRIRSGERPECVSASGVAPQRVAAESVPSSDWNKLEADGGARVTKDFTVLRRLTPGGDGVRATYGNATCPIDQRYKAIDSLNTDGTVNYRPYHSFHPPRSTPGYRLKGWRGPRGEPGAGHDDASLKGPRGRCGNKYCARTIPYTYTYRCGWYRDSQGRWRSSRTCTGTSYRTRRC